MQPLRVCCSGTLKRSSRRLARASALDCRARSIQLCLTTPVDLPPFKSNIHRGSGPPGVGGSVSRAGYPYDLFYSPFFFFANEVSGSSSSELSSDILRPVFAWGQPERASKNSNLDLYNVI